MKRCPICGEMVHHRNKHMKKNHYKEYLKKYPNYIDLNGILDLEKFLKGDSPKTFLTGAGCSHDPPSNLPLGRGMMQDIIQYTCPKPEIKKIDLNQLRFEEVIEFLQQGIDEELKVIEFYEQCDKPNLQHFFLARMISNGHFVMTTNFDSLIEYALLESTVSPEKILPVITEDDFKKYNNPLRLLEQGKKAIYKIHGSTKNIITNESTMYSLIATIQALGRNKGGLNIFSIEDYKKTLLENIVDGRSLVLMGYSGSDDFDIIPTLMELENIENIVWISHLEDNSGTPKIKSFHNEYYNKSEFDSIDEILIKLKRTQNAVRLFRVEVNTSKFIQKHFGSELPQLSLNPFPITPLSWLEDKLGTLLDEDKYYAAHRLYIRLDKFNDALRCAEVVLDIIRSDSALVEFQVSILNNMGVALQRLHRYPEALEKLTEALHLAKQLEDPESLGETYKNIGSVNEDLKKYSIALEVYKLALAISKDHKLQSLESQCHNNIAVTYQKLQDRSRKTSDDEIKEIEKKIIFHLKKAIKIDEELENLLEKANHLINLGNFYRDIGQIREAKKIYNVALDTHRSLKNRRGECICLGQIGKLYYIQENLETALKKFTQALEIAQRHGYPKLENDSLLSISTIEDIKKLHRKKKE